MTAATVTQIHPTMKKLTMPQLVKEMGALFPEREDQLAGLAMAACAKEHILLIGEPGTAKSLMSRIFAACLDASYFEVLMHAYSTPEETLGPIALSGLQNDRYIRATKSYAPEAQVVFLTEVFKSNAGMLNALLTLLNERAFHNDGKVTPCPLMTCIGDSNELQESAQLDALADRFMFRYMVPYIVDPDNFMKMLVAPVIAPPGCIDLAGEQAATLAVVVTPDTVVALKDLRFGAFSTSGYKVSDRRWRQSIGLIKAAAHLAGRTATEVDDLECLEHVLWKQPDQRVAISKLVQQTISPDGAKAVQELDNAREIFRKIPAPGGDPGQYMGALGQSIQDLKGIVQRLQAMPSSRKVKAALDEASLLKQKAGRLALTASGVET